VRGPGPACQHQLAGGLASVTPRSTRAVPGEAGAVAGLFVNPAASRCHTAHSGVLPGSGAQSGREVLSTPAGVRPRRGQRGQHATDHVVGGCDESRTTSHVIAVRSPAESGPSRTVTLHGASVKKRLGSPPRVPVVGQVVLVTLDHRERPSPTSSDPQPVAGIGSHPAGREPAVAQHLIPAATRLIQEPVASSGLGSRSPGQPDRLSAVCCRPEFGPSACG